MCCGVVLDDEYVLVKVVEYLYCYFDGGYIFLVNEDVIQVICVEEVGNIVFKIVVLIIVCQVLYGLQLLFRKFFGLVVDGCDMGIVIFFGVWLKVFLIVSVEVCVIRCYK